ncbi:hypothetical protein CBS147326_5748 [Penicillium roqueforti]|nr:hypothetical protein CBS147326_5748 [Penicillium roqueforti]
MPPLNDSEQHERMLTALRRGIHDLRSKPENRMLVIERLNAISRLARICVQVGKDARFTRLCDTLQREMPRQIALLKSDINSNLIVANALAQMILESSTFTRSIVVFNSEDETDEQSELDPSDDNYIARLLLGSKWAKEVVDLPEEPYKMPEVFGSAREDEAEMDPSHDDHIARLLLGPSWATPIADFAEEPYKEKKAAGK